MKKVLCFLLAVMVVVVGFWVVPVKADPITEVNITDDLGDTTEINDYDWDNLKVDDIVISESARPVVTEAISALVAKGYNETAVAAILGNAFGESEFVPDCHEKDGTGEGLWQWSHDRRSTLCDESVKSCPHGTSMWKIISSNDKYNGSAYCKSPTCQVRVLDNEMKGRLDGNRPSMNYNDRVKDSSYADTIGKAVKDGAIPGTIRPLTGASAEEKVTNFKTGYDGSVKSDLASLTIIFWTDWETAASTGWTWDKADHLGETGDFVTGFAKRYGAAKAVYKLITGSDSGIFTTGTVSENLKLVPSGFYTDDEIAAFSRLYEPNINETYIDNATRDKLTSDELSVIHDWENNNEMGSKGSGFISFIRKMVSLFGIIIIIWSFFLYVAYWLDKMNNLIDISFVTILTLGKLATHMDDTTKCTFHEKVDGKAARTIDHSTVVFISVIGMGFGALVVSGALYTWLAKFVYWVLGKLGQLG